MSQLPARRDDRPAGFVARFMVSEQHTAVLYITHNPRRRRFMWTRYVFMLENWSKTRRLVPYSLTTLQPYAQWDYLDSVPWLVRRHGVRLTATIPGQIPSLTESGRCVFAPRCWPRSMCFDNQSRSVDYGRSTALVSLPPLAGDRCRRNIRVQSIRRDHCGHGRHKQ